MIYLSWMVSSINICVFIYLLIYDIFIYLCISYLRMYVFI